MSSHSVLHILGLMDDASSGHNQVKQLKSQITEVIEDLKDAYDDAYYRPDAQFAIQYALEKLMLQVDFQEWLRDNK